jgi:hypothetical protein
MNSKTNKKPLGTQVRGVIKHDQFMAELHELFPSMRDEIDPEIESGLVHLEMSAFRRFTEQVIKAGNRSELIRCFQFLERLLVCGDGNVQNAVGVSFLEDLPHDDQSMEWAWKFLPTSLRSAWIDVSEYNDKIHGTAVAAQIKSLLKRS